VIQEIWGLNLNMQQMADKFASAGFKALCPEFYDGKVVRSRDEAKHMRAGLNWDDAVDTIRGAAKYLKSQGCDSVGAVGFCMGGALVVAALASDNNELNAGVCFYGTPDLTKFKSSNIKSPILLLFGKNDESKGFSDEETATKLFSELQQHKVDSQLVIYDKVGHAFMNRDRPDVFNQQVANLSFDRCCEFFRKNLPTK